MTDISHPPGASPAAEPAEVPPRDRRLLVAALLIVALALAVGLWFASRPAPPQLQGMVDADQVNVATKALARVEKLIAEEGQTVKAGALLATLTSPEIDAGRRQAEGALASARALEAMANEGNRAEDVRALRSVWQSAQAAAGLAAVTARRADNLFAEGVIAAQRRDEAHAARDASAAQAEAARQQYLKAASGTRAEEKDVARAQVEVAAAGVSTAEALQAETKLIAPIGGEISKKLAEAGEIVGPAVPIYQIIDTAHPWVAVNVRENDYKGIAPGLEMRGDIPALKLKGVPFTVYHIDPQGDFATWRATRQSSGFDIRSFEVKLRPTRPVAGLRPGMSVLFAWPR
ncbi:multidrug resistance efflux pump [Sphingomonas sp. MM-1]|uniref:HlyD family secretion protein n=1 Tax=Sphingomonas sp. MM-1 TaxID=745310 RepID=UPI0002C09700|nr:MULTISPECIES: efflux RND transporter periplasmic adaptor subunit [unclassified Sphingomonas]AGH48216.1 multidrug resistance efflux pump [Sphingomonas sp. MM-1]MDX3886150.1 efflux RND transporter periplasmic adaptor subunit [Sphingomonas sp.]